MRRGWLAPDLGAGRWRGTGCTGREGNESDHGDHPDTKIELAEPAIGILTLAPQDLQSASRRLSSSTNRPRALLLTHAPGPRA